MSDEEHLSSEELIVEQILAHAEIRTQELDRYIANLLPDKLASLDLNPPGGASMGRTFGMKALQKHYLEKEIHRYREDAAKQVNDVIKDSMPQIKDRAKLRLDKFLNPRVAGEKEKNISQAMDNANDHLLEKGREHFKNDPFAKAENEKTPPEKEFSMRSRFSMILNFNNLNKSVIDKGKDSLDKAGNTSYGTRFTDTLRFAAVQYGQDKEVEPDIRSDKRTHDIDRD